MVVIEAQEGTTHTHNHWDKQKPEVDATSYELGKLFLLRQNEFDLYTKVS